MKRSRFSEEQIIAILKEQENGFMGKFNGSFRDECLNETLFSSLTDALHHTLEEGLQCNQTPLITGKSHTA